MSDTIDRLDRASEIEDALRDDALQAQRRRAGLTDKTVDDSALDCQVCAAAIPLARRAAYPGTQLCVSCQTDLEHELRKFRR